MQCLDFLNSYDQSVKCYYELPSSAEISHLPRYDKWVMSESGLESELSNILYHLFVEYYNKKLPRAG
jgi:hypothetical protein